MSHFTSIRRSHTAWCVMIGVCSPRRLALAKRQRERECVPHDADAYGADAYGADECADAGRGKEVGVRDAEGGEACVGSLVDL